MPPIDKDYVPEQDDKNVEPRPDESTRSESTVAAKIQQPFVKGDIDKNADKTTPFVLGSRPQIKEQRPPSVESDVGKSHDRSSTGSIGDVEVATRKDTDASRSSLGQGPAETSDSEASEVSSKSSKATSGGIKEKLSSITTKAKETLGKLSTFSKTEAETHAEIQKYFNTAVANITRLRQYKNQEFKNPETIVKLESDIVSAESKWTSFKEQLKSNNPSRYSVLKSFIEKVDDEYIMYYVEDVKSKIQGSMPKPNLDESK
jgi:hypothetical protein